jgi:hypothetical protein
MNMMTIMRPTTMMTVTTSTTTTMIRMRITSAAKTTAPIARLMSRPRPTTIPAIPTLN